MKKIIFALGLIALTNLAFAQATPVKFDDEVSGQFIFSNPCTGEDVLMDFTSTISVRGVTNANRANLTIHINEKYDGVGQTTGANYVGHGSLSQHQNVSLSNGTGNANAIVNVNINTSGGGNNFKISQSFHITVNANGVVTVNRGAFSAVCQ